MSRVSDILQAMGQAAGQRQADRGAFLGSTVSALGRLPGQVLGAQEQQRRQAYEEARQRERDARDDETYQMRLRGERSAQKKDEVLRGGIAAGFGDSQDPAQFSVPRASQFVIEAGFPELVTTISDIHTKLNPAPVEFDPTKGARDPRTGAVVREPRAPAPKTTLDYIGLSQNPNPVVSAFATGVLKKEREQNAPQATKNYQRDDKLLDGKRTTLLFDPAPGGKVYDLNGQEIANAAERVRPIPPAAITINNDRMKGAPGDFTQSGDAFLQTIPLQWRRTVENVANYKSDPTKVASMRGGMRETLTQWVNQVNPAYDASKFSVRAETRKAYTTGTQGQTLNALNTGIGHLDQFTVLADRLGNGAFVPGNKIWNELRDIFGSDKASNFETLADALAGEITKTLNGGQATVSGIAEQRRLMNAYKSPTALAGYVKTLIPVLGSKLTNLNYQFHQAMGDADPFDALSPDSRRILEKHGFDPDHPTIEPGAPTTPTLTPGPYNLTLPKKKGDVSQAAPVDRATFGVRADGSPKGDGFLGVLRRPDGKVSSEISIGVNLDGQEVEIPTLVPTLTAVEKNWLLTHDPAASKIPQPIIDKAVAFARARKQQGKPFFAQPGESPGAPQADADPYADPQRLARDAVFGGLPAVAPTPDFRTENVPVSWLEQQGAMLSQGDLPQRVTDFYTQQGPEALGQGLREFHTALQTHLPKGRVPLRAVAPALNKTIAGAGTTLLPAAYGAVGHPLAAVVSGLVGMGVAGGAEATATKLGADPDTASFIGNLAGFIEPQHFAMAALPFAPYARRTLMGALEKEAAARVRGLVQANPQIGPLLKWLHPSETVALSKMTPAAQAEFVRVHQALPSNDLLGALGRAGLEKRGWYEHSRAAIAHVYGDDADLFAGILAATSPQNSVEMNLRNATHIYRGWVQAGRPTDRDAILGIMGQNVLGTKGEESVLDSWKNNTVAVLQGGQAISGPKVDSFWRNLRSRAVETPQGAMRPDDAVTLDAWMSNVLGVQQTNFAGGTANLEARNPGYSPGYLAATARLRHAATQHEMTPEQLQETIWSWGKALYEQAEATGESAVDIIRHNRLNHSQVAGTPDFSTLFHQPGYREAIQASGSRHAAQLDTLQPASFPAVEAASASDRQWQLKAAATLDRLRESRQIASNLRVGANTPGTVNVNLLQEGMPGSTTRVAPELATSAFTQHQRDRLGRQLLAPNTDVRGENVLLKALGLPTTETTVGLGQWTPPGGGPTQYNTLDAAGVQARLRRGTVHPDDARRILTAAKLQGLLDAQDAVATTGVVYDQAHKDTLHVFTQNKVKQDVFEGLAKLLPKDYALVNKGGGTPGHVIDILRLDGQPVGAAEEELVRGYLTQQQKAGARPIATTLGTNVGGTYVQLPWDSGPGSGQVTAAALADYDALSKTARAGLDSAAIKRMAAAKLRFWETTGPARGLTVPEDYRRMLRIVADGGVSALRRAMENPAQILPALLLLGLARPATESRQTPGRPSS